MRGWWPKLALGMLALAGGAAADTAPRVESATPGIGGGSIERFTWRFSEPMVPLGDPRAAAPVTSACPVGGQGRWIDAQSFVWDYATPLPGGMTCRFTLVPGLRSVRGAAVEGERGFAVDTGGPSARAVLAGRDDDAIAEDAVFLVATNLAPDRASVAREAYCAVDGIGEKIAVDVLKPEVPGAVLGGLGTDRYEVTNFLDEAGLPKTLPAAGPPRDRALASVIAVRCRRPLPPGRDMALVWPASVVAPSGRKAGSERRFDFTVRKSFEARFECSRVNPRAGCNPIEPAYVRFTAPVPRAVAAQVRITAGGRTLTPTIEGHDAEVMSLSFARPLPEAATGQVTLPDGIRDIDGRPLTNARRFPLEVRFDAAPPLVKFAADFGILEAAEGGVLPVTVRAVEPALAGRIAGVGGAVARVDGTDGAIASWLRRIEKAAESEYREEGPKDHTHSVNYTGAASLLKSEAAAKPLDLKLPGAGKDFEVVGVPLGRPGFYVVELASPTLGRALLGRDAPRYVAAGALVTNMAVHFKWGRANSLAWVTSLDGGRPVAGAQVAVSDSCDGRTLARGTTDPQGRMIVRGGLPEPSTYGSCDPESTHPLMVSARKAGDFSFTLTRWDNGLEPSDFELPFGWEAPGPIVHTVFDRTLIRQGETVAMKQVLRLPVARGFAAAAFDGTLRLSHRGSDTVFELPLAIGRDGIGETRWTAPKGAPLGDYDLAVVAGDKTIDTGQSLRVDEYRLPTMRATVSGPKAGQVRPKAVPIDLYVGYLSGGGASNLPVAVRAAFEPDVAAPKGWDGWTFGGRRIVEGLRPLDGDNNEIEAPLPPAQTLPVTLDRQGAARTSIEVPATLDGAATMNVEMDYQDANGETLTAASSIALHPSAVRVGLKTDGWLMRDDDLRLKLVAVDLDGHPIRGQRIKVALYSREILSARRRLIGGFYAYDNNARTKKIGATCSATTDAQGLATCALAPGVSGEVYAVATTADASGNESRATTSVWLAGEDEWWFGGDNGDRMDLVPEHKDYPANGVARLQVRMPFRQATALVTVEREGVLSSFVTTLSGRDPVVEVPLNGAYAPDVYVSVMAVRGRIGGWRLWLADFARRWHLPFFSREGARPTALVDLAKPSYRLGIARLNVGWEAHALKVAVRTDRAKYRVRDTAQVAVEVRGADGRPSPSAEIAFAAVDEAILQLAPNPSWQLIDAMMGERPLSVVTSTAAMQVVGKRHYGRKAVAAGGGGGDLAAVNRADFRPVLLWRGRVPLDAAGRARIAVPLSDSLSAFRLVAVATAGADRFGTGEATVRTTQDLTLYAGLPPLVREGDRYAASFTLRNGSDREMTVTATAEVSPRVGTAPPLTVTIPAGGAVPVDWTLPAPAGIGRLTWTVTARAADGRATDRITATQDVVPAVPVETWAATLLRVGEGGPLPLAAPAGALPGRGGVEIRLSAGLSPPLAGVRAYMAAYPYECLEQRTSRAVALGDSGLWGRIAGDLPAYIDADGLLRYWPVDGSEGSEALTAYILSVTREAGLAIPAGAKARIVAALQGVVAGRIAHDAPGTGERRLLKVAALAALARSGAADAGMFAEVGMAARDMPTSALADWIVALDRTPGADPAAKRQAEAVLRSRLVYAGSRLDLADQGAAPWWMMVSGDEMVARTLLATLGRQGWQAEGPRMTVGFASRQRQGHWDTTPANAWGALAARRFAALYPPDAVAGTTLLTLGAAVQRRTWPVTDPLVRLPLPARPTPLMLSQSGGAGPWAAVAVRAAVPLTAPLAAGYRVARQVSVIRQKVPGRLTRGDVLRVRLTVEASAERNWVVVDDPIPAGATIVGSLGGQSAQLGAAAGGGEGEAPSYVERTQAAWRGYWAWLPRGRVTVEYAVRLNGVGTFQLPPTRVAAMYAPDIRAALPNRAVTVAAR